MSVRRVCIHSERAEGPVAVDVALPSDAPVGELLPAIVDMVGDLYQSQIVVDGWRLDRLEGAALTESLSLTDNGVRDGELLVLTQLDAPALGPMAEEPCREVAATEPSGFDATRFLPGASCVLACLAAALALVWTGVSVDSTSALFVAGAGACAAIAAALARARSTALGVVSVTLAAATGYLAVPSGPSAANVFLAAAAGFATSLLMLRLTRSASSTLVATASFSSLVAAATAISIPVAAIGAALATASLGLLAAAPRITVVVAGLGPDHWTSGLASRATGGHAMLTGLVAGCTVGATSGSTLVAISGIDRGATPYGPAAFAGMIAAVLVLRARTYVDAPRQIALVAGGLASGVACFTVVVASHPGQVEWFCGALVAIGLAAATRPPLGATVTRLVDRLEYAALATVVPLACWVSGVYELVRGVHL